MITKLYHNRDRTVKVKCFNNCHVIFEIGGSRLLRGITLLRDTPIIRADT